MKIRLAVALVELVFGFAVPAFAQQKEPTPNQVSTIKSHGFFCGMMASSDFVRISPFRRSANVDSVDRLPPAS
jgi:hypothetical protein